MKYLLIIGQHKHSLTLSPIFSVYKLTAIDLCGLVQKDKMVFEDSDLKALGFFFP